MELQFLLLFLLLLSCPSRPYSLHNCTISRGDPSEISCDDVGLYTVPLDIPRSATLLSVARNNLQRVRQSDFQGLHVLQKLDLHSNQISVVEGGAFSNLSSLTELSLTDNTLEDLTEDMFVGLSNLTVLSLQLNRINDLPASTFAPLTKLQKLDLSHNFICHIGDILKGVSVCPALTAIDLSWNFLPSLDSEEFESPLNVTDLNLSNMFLARVALHSDVLPQLESLSLESSNSELEWDVSDKAFLKSVRTLDLTATRLRAETYFSIVQSTPQLENLLLNDVGLWDMGVLSLACRIPTLQMIELKLNYISAIDESQLLLCSNLTELDLSDNQLLSLSPLATQRLSRLSILYMSSNGQTNVPPAIGNMSSLTSLWFDSNSIIKLRCSDFLNLSLLTILDLSDNKLSELRGCVFQNLHSLQTLYIEGNFIVTFDGSFGVSVSNLRLIRAHGNDIVRIQKGAFKNMSHLEDLQFESLRGTFVEEGAFNELTGLRILSFSLSLINHSIPAGVGTLLGSGGRSWTQGVFNLPSLEILSLTVPDVISVMWPRDFLRGLYALKDLSLVNCFTVPPDSGTFSHTPHLSQLQISHNKRWLPVPQLFQPLSALQSLDLNDNELKSLDFLFEANLTQLQMLILENNGLSVIDVTVFEALPSLRYLDLSLNPFACNCSNADFVHWVVRNKQVYVSEAFRYQCASPSSHQGALLLEFDIRWCWEFDGLLCFICSSSLVLLTLLSAFLHHFLRLHLLYGFYLLRAFLYHRQKRRQGCAELYDAFVSYNVHDEEWVYRKLVPELEGRQGWRLCLHHRDFEPGKAILENITDAIYSSRKTLCVVSRRYLLSEWCSREVQMASYRLLDEKKDVLILLFLEELSSNQLSPFFRMRKLMRSRTYLSWSGARDHRGLFWERVRHALQSGAQLPADHPLPSDPLQTAH